MGYKYVFGQAEIEFLGNTVNANGIHPPKDRVAAVTEMPPPKTDC